MADPNPVVVAPTQSSWFSKINWTIAVTFIVNVLTFLGFVVPAELESAALLAINSVIGLAVIIMRTWFTKSITTASAKSM
jgi:hypothetical protein